jgi:cytochrome oxidase Cu insertion factor (SCO1/SenC/PrrC family)
VTTPLDTRTVRRNRILLVGLFAITIVPMFGAFWLYQSSRSAAPWATTNRGELLNPIVPVDDLGLASADGVTSMRNSGQWWLVVVTEDGCTSECQTAVHQLRQLHILLGRDATRVKRSLVSLGGHAVDASLAQYPELVRFTGETAALRPGVYIVDPLGNVVLRYDYRSADKPVLEDMKQLLKVSHIG